MANANIGHMTCPMSGELCVVRADKRGKLYWFSLAGKISPNLPIGQQFIKENATLWPDKVQPANIEIREIVFGAPPVVRIVNTPIQAENDPQISASNDESNQPGQNSNTPKPKVRAKTALGYLWGGDDE